MAQNSMAARLGGYDHHPESLRYEIDDQSIASQHG